MSVHLAGVLSVALHVSCTPLKLGAKWLSQADLGGPNGRQLWVVGTENCSVSCGGCLSLGPELLKGLEPGESSMWESGGGESCVDQQPGHSCRKAHAGCWALG